MSILGEITALTILLRGAGLHSPNSEAPLTPEVADPAMHVLRSPTVISSCSFTNTLGGMSKWVFKENLESA